MVISILDKLVGGWTWSLIAYGKRTRGQRLLPCDNLERTLAHGLALLQVKGELGNIKQFRPISLVGTYKVPQAKLQESIDPLGLSITLRVETGGEVEFGTHELEQLCPKTPNKTSVPIAYSGSK